MFYEAYQYYAKNLSNSNLIFKKIIVWFFVYVVLFIVIGGLLNSLSQINGAFGFIGIPLNALLLALLLNSKIKKFLKKKYGIESEEFLWGGWAWENYTKNMLKDYITQTLALSNSKIKELAVIANDEAESLRKKFPFITSAFILLFAPLWNSYLGSFFKTQITPEQAFKIFGNKFLLIIGIVFILFILKVVYVDSIINEFVNSKYRKMKKFAKMLNHISLET